MSSFTAVNAHRALQTPPPDVTAGPAIPPLVAAATPPGVATAAGPAVPPLVAAATPPDVATAAGPAVPPLVAPATPPGVATGPAVPPLVTAATPPDVATAAGPAVPPLVAAATPPDVAPSTGPRRMLRSGAYKAVGDAFLAMCDTYLANDRPRTMQASAKAAIKRYDDGDLTAKQLADFISAFYEAISTHQDVCQEQAAWLSGVERKKDHWKKLGYVEYEDYLSAIDPHGKARTMIDMHHETVRRRTHATNTVQECWAGSPELLELLAVSDGESKWVSLAGLARATDRAPEVAKYSLNQAILTRIRSGKTGRGAVRAFVLPDLIAARKFAETIDWVARPWDKEEYEGISDLGMKLYRGLVLSKKRYPGQEDTRRTRPAQNIQVSATTPGPSSTPGHQLTAENLAAVDATTGTEVPHIHQARSVSSSPGLSPAPSRLETPPCEGNTPAAGLPTPVTLLRRRALTADPARLAGSQEEHGTPSQAAAPSSQRTKQAAAAPSSRRTKQAAAAPSSQRTEQAAAAPSSRRTEQAAAAPSSQRTEQAAAAPSSQPTEQAAAFRAKFGITDPELFPSSSFSFHDALEEVTGGRSQEWYDKKEIRLQGCLDWLLKDDQEVVEMLSYERQLIKHHNGNKDPWEFTMSLAHQAARQDPGMYLIAVACLKNSLVVSVPFKGEGSFFLELDLDHPAGNMRLACQPSPLAGGRRLSLAWAAVSEDGARIEDSVKSSWGKYVIAHAQAGLESTPGSVHVRSASALGSAMLCQIPYFTPAVFQNGALITGDDRTLVRNVIQRTRGEILRQLKAAFRQLVMAEQFHHQGDSYYYATLGEKRAASNTDNNPKGKKLRRSQRHEQRAASNTNDNNPKGKRLRRA